jgi:hypothetical protein
MSEKKPGIACGKCGFENRSGAKYCLNCWKKLDVSAESARTLRSFEGLSLLHLTGSVYVLVSVLFNELVRISLLSLAPYLAVV